MGLGILESALVGAIGGWGEALAKLGEMEWKEEALKKREEYLSKNRMAERETELRTSDKIKDESATRERDRLGMVAREVEAALPTGKAAWSGYKQGDAIDAGEASEVPLTEAEKSRRRTEGYAQRGERGMVKDEMDRLEKERRFEADERRTDVADRATAQRDRELSRREAHDSKMAEIAMKRLENAEKRIAEGNGSEKDTARIREAHFLARTEFGGDPKNMESPEYKEALKKAVSRVFREQDDKDYTTVTKTSYDEKGDQIRETKRVGAGKSSESSASVAKPATKADYDKLPSGSLYISPKDGKTYRKP